MRRLRPSRGEMLPRLPRADEMEIIEIECGGKAWICCSLDRALNPTKLMALEQTSEWATPITPIK
jgi:hypothetical protein